MDECRRKGKNVVVFLYVLSQCVIKQADRCNKLSQLTDNFMSGHMKVTIQCYCFVSELHVYNSHVIREGFHVLYMRMVLSVLYKPVVVLKAVKLKDL